MLKEIKGLVETTINEGRGVFSYLREPYEKAEEIISKGVRKSEGLTSDDIYAAANQLLVRKYIKKIKNYDKIIDKAERQFDILLQKASEEEVSMNIPDDDWLEYFFDLSSRVSNENVQEIWAHLLLQEHFQNGSIKKVMLNTLALLDAESAKCFQNLCSLTYKMTIEEDIRYIPFVIYDYNIDNLLVDYEGDKRPFMKYLEICPEESQLDYLAELGLITTTNLTESVYNVYFTEASEVSFSCCGKTITIESPYMQEENMYQVEASFVFFTQVGLSLYHILKVTHFEGLFDVVKRFAENQIPD